jgi:hypothetical protein
MGSGGGSKPGICSPLSDFYKEIKIKKLKKFYQYENKKLKLFVKNILLS